MPADGAWRKKSTPFDANGVQWLELIKPAKQANNTIYAIRCGATLLKKRLQIEC